MAKIKWKTAAEIEKENKAPAPANDTARELIEIKLAIAELAEIMLGGDNVG